MGRWNAEVGRWNAEVGSGKVECGSGKVECGLRRAQARQSRNEACDEISRIEGGIHLGPIYFIEITSCLHMIYAIARLNILAILPVESIRI